MTKYYEPNHALIDSPPLGPCVLAYLTYLPLSFFLSFPP